MTMEPKKRPFFSTTPEQQYLFYNGKIPEKKTQQIEYIKRAYFQNRDYISIFDWKNFCDGVYYGEFGRLASKYKFILYLCISCIAAIFIGGYLADALNQLNFILYFIIAFWLLFFFLIRALHKRSKDRFFAKMRRP